METWIDERREVSNSISVTHYCLQLQRRWWQRSNLALAGGDVSRAVWCWRYHQVCSLLETWEGLAQWRNSIIGSWSVEGYTNRLLWQHCLWQGGCSLMRERWVASALDMVETVVVISGDEWMVMLLRAGYCFRGRLNLGAIIACSTQCSEISIQGPRQAAACSKDGTTLKVMHPWD